MKNYEYKKVDFDHPSILFILEDMLKGILGGPLLYNRYYKTFKLQGNEKVLDFGCGGGTGSKCLIRFLTQNGRLTCVDTSKYWINRARKRLRKYPNAESILGDIRKLNFPDASFDVITIIHVIHDIEPTERESTVQALSRTLENGGTLFIREPMRKSHGMPVEEIRNLLKGTGLKAVKDQVQKTEYLGKFIK